MSSDRLTTGKATDCLVDNSLEDRSRQVFLGSAFIDQGLNVCLGKYTTSCSNSI